MVKLEILGLDHPDENSGSQPLLVLILYGECISMRVYDLQPSFGLARGWLDLDLDLE